MIDKLYFGHHKNDVFGSGSATLCADCLNSYTGPLWLVDEVITDPDRRCQGCGRSPEPVAARPGRSYPSNARYLRQQAIIGDVCPACSEDRIDSDGFERGIDNTIYENLWCPACTLNWRVEYQCAGYQLDLNGNYLSPEEANDYDDS